MERLEEIIEGFAAPMLQYQIEDALSLLAKEVLEQRKQIAELRLLIQHEEQIRTTKATKQVRAKRVTEKFKHGDRVKRVNSDDRGMIGTVTAISGKRIAIQFNKNQTSDWFDSKEFTHSVAS